MWIFEYEGKISQVRIAKCAIKVEYCRNRQSKSVRIAKFGHVANFGNSYLASCTLAPLSSSNAGSYRTIVFGRSTGPVLRVKNPCTVRLRCKAVVNNFGRPFLGCSEADFWKKLLNLQNLVRSEYYWFSLLRDWRIAQIVRQNRRDNCFDQKWLLL